MTRNCVFISLLLIVAMAASCRKAGDRSPVIVTLNGHDIHRDEFERFLSSEMSELNPADTPDSVRSQMLDEYIKRRLVLDEAERIGLSTTIAEIDQAVEQNPQLKPAAGTAPGRAA